MVWVFSISVESTGFLFCLWNGICTITQFTWLQFQLEVRDGQTERQLDRHDISIRYQFFHVCFCSSKIQHRLLNFGRLCSGKLGANKITHISRDSGRNAKKPFNFVTWSDIVFKWRAKKRARVNELRGAGCSVLISLFAFKTCCQQCKKIICFSLRIKGGFGFFTRNVLFAKHKLLWHQSGF